MKYLSIDIEATGLNEDCYIIEYAMIPFDAKTKTLEESLTKEFTIWCPSFEELKPKLDQWVIEHNKELIDKSHSEGIKLDDFKKNLENYFESQEVQEYFENKPIVIFGKSINAIDLPFLTRDLGWDWMRKYFNHRTHDLTSVVYAFIDQGKLPEACESGSELMKHLGMGEVAHTALEDARNTALMYFKLL